MSNEGLNNEELNDQFQVRRDKMNIRREDSGAGLSAPGAPWGGTGRRRG